MAKKLSKLPKDIITIGDLLDFNETSPEMHLERHLERKELRAFIKENLTDHIKDTAYVVIIRQNRDGLVTMASDALPTTTLAMLSQGAFQTNRSIAMDSIIVVEDEDEDEDEDE